MPLSHLLCGPCQVCTHSASLLPPLSHYTSCLPFSDLQWQPYAFHVDPVKCVLTPPHFCHHSVTTQVVSHSLTHSGSPMPLSHLLCGPCQVCTHSAPLCHHSATTQVVSHSLTHSGSPMPLSHLLCGLCQARKYDQDKFKSILQ